MTEAVLEKPKSLSDNMQELKELFERTLKTTERLLDEVSRLNERMEQLEKRGHISKKELEAKP